MKKTVKKKKTATKRAGKAATTRPSPKAKLMAKPKAKSRPAPKTKARPAQKPAARRPAPAQEARRDTGHFLLEVPRIGDLRDVVDDVPGFDPVAPEDDGPPPA